MLPTFVVRVRDDICKTLSAMSISRCLLKGEYCYYYLRP